MTTAEVISSEKQQYFRDSALSASTVVDRVKGRQCTYSEDCNEIVEEVEEFRAKEFFLNFSNYSSPRSCVRKYF
jgi:hypothetical protein